MSRSAFAVLIVFLFAGTLRADIKTREVEYEQGGTKLTGFFAWDDAGDEKRPGVLVVHEWWGLNDYARSRAKQLAGLGYVAFALDMYGEGKVTEHPEQAGEWSAKIRENTDRWRARALAGLDVLKGHGRVDPERLAAIGYCFGGSTVLQLACAGAGLDGVVSFHGGMIPPEAVPSDGISTHILICQGGADAFVSDESIASFRAALEKVGADYEINYYGGARHSFTNPDADSKGIENLKYNAVADRRSWRDMQQLFTELFGDDQASP